MHPEFQQLMSQATQLTRSGDLAAATAAIQAALRGGLPAAHARRDDSDVIEVEAWEIPDSPGAGQATSDDVVTPARPAGVRGDTFIAGSFRNSAGQRGYKLYVPPNPDNTPRPLVVMLHGCTQDADDFAAGTAMNAAAREQGFYVLYPVQSREANPQKCWNWFKHNHQQQGRGEPSILAGMTRDVIGAHPIDAGRVYVAGLSAGGAMAAILAGAYPGLYAAAGVHSGLAPGVASDLPSALAAMKGAGIRAGAPAGSGVPTIVFHGDRDATVHPGNAESVIAASAGPGVRAETLRVPGAAGKRHSTRHVYRNAAGDIIAERWDVHGAGHAWAGGTEQGSYTDRTGPDATAEMLRFFFERGWAGKQ
ncbi:alpha/beta hydrolase family esterase [Achromobacter deleyi]|uniref:extracellular catalytic domain type 1 short-chain-length polyhydroxyalkanoate depolymerase n=1 Tax=Achromobacter deleyi TaxID=1353891 RepID=UPI001492E676|nr:PHB depolymerase family esterase [Achromobacter deleyi]QVQ27724.1 PHB depolymerase family esterase [Achromobacter deleyi]UIP23326.1 PHB depolymerase family esterase [Achromobacter deleyi]